MTLIPDSTPNQADVIIVGAGIAGLSCATRLAEAGLRVLVLESSDVPGGRARSWADPGTGIDVDIGPHVLLNKYPNMRALLECLGTADQICWQTEELLTVLDEGKHLQFKVGGLPAPLHYVRNLPQVLRKVPLHHLFSNIRLGWRTMRSTPQELMSLDDQSGRDYLRSVGVSPGFIDWFWASASMAILNVPVEQCSAASLMRLLAQGLGHNDLAFGFPKVGLSELYAWPAIRLLERSGGEIRFNRAVNGLHRRDADVAGVTLADGSTVNAAAVVLAVQPTAIESVLPPDHSLASTAARFEPSPYVSCYLWFDRPLTNARFWARPWSPECFNTDFYDLSNIRNGATGPGSMIATNIIWSHRVAGMSDQAIIDATLDEIADFAPEARQAHLVNAAVHRIPMSVPCARPGIETSRPQVRQEQGLFVAGDWVDTGLPFCMESATRAGALAAEQVLAERGVTVSLALPTPVPGGLTKWLRRNDSAKGF
ncbi:FAD-dependent oxidoreductase [Stutzerimonas zhaodongensis]|uniref:FAD-dependent oxidoreductase n=1 Tax=Stutzerimonas zhaodongensis TaxID=1176257 RepID=A0A3M2HYE5_9GAMM|nr:FAD-dependent oxidoreductase [Stutzerimonas zhaodongensis]MCQ4318522.1 FAD-dependent oxidoreductase [Stutzerimonas zhaodongensis]RMH91932.1 FAD-dependent oxidoreductase [Stutzerimonas zhaodongensis]